MFEQTWNCHEVRVQTRLNMSSWKRRQMFREFRQTCISCGARKPEGSNRPGGRTHIQSISLKKYVQAMRSYEWSYEWSYVIIWIFEKNTSFESIWIYVPYVPHPVSWCWTCWCFLIRPLDDWRDGEKWLSCRNASVNPAGNLSESNMCIHMPL